jgi:diguanylate cyclase (GGDEF)-like protein
MNPKESRKTLHRIIIVDDDNSIVDAMESSHYRDDVETRVFANSDGIVDKIDEWTPDLALLNINICSSDLLRDLKKRHQCMAIILISDSKIDQEVVDLLEQSSDDYLAKPFYSEDLMTKVRIQLRIKDLNEQLDRIKDSGEIDIATGLFTLRAIMARLEHELARGKRFNRSVCVVLIEIDPIDPKMIAEDHLISTYVVVELSKLMKSSIRNIDLVGRYGKNSYIVVLAEVPKQGAAIFCERIRVKIENCQLKREKIELNPTASIGFVITNPAAPDIETKHLLSVAEKALNDSQIAGGNRFSFYDISENLDLQTAKKAI